MNCHRTVRLVDTGRPPLIVVKCWGSPIRGTVVGLLQEKSVPYTPKMLPRDLAWRCLLGVLGGNSDLWL